MNGGRVRTLLGREVRSALRDKTIVLNSVLMPIFLYPFFLWAAFTGVTFVQGRTEGFTSRLAVPDWPAGHAALRRDWERDAEIELVTTAAEARIRAGELDAIVEFLPAEGNAARLAGNFAVRLTLDAAKERSAAAGRRVRGKLERYRVAWLAREAAARGLDAAAWRVFTVEERNVASEREMGAFLLGLMAPLFFVVMVAVGCFYPAVDATAGERERGTWETLLQSAATRGEIVLSKYLAVALFGFVAGILNLAAVTLTMKPVLGPLLEQTGETLEFTVPLAAVPVLLLGAALLAAFVAAGMMVFASFARTFKDGQASITPFYLVILLPAMFLQVPGLTLSVPLALVPVVNVTLMVREAISGTFRPAEIGVTVLASAAAIAAFLALARVILAAEDVVVGSYTGNIAAFFRRRLRGQGLRRKETS